MKKVLPLYRFGWAFLLAWVFAIFYTHMVEGYTGSYSVIVESQGYISQFFFMAMPVLFSVLTLLIIVRFEKRFGSPLKNPRLRLLAPIFIALSCPFLFIQTTSLELTAALFAVGALFTGIGSGLMWVMWGEYYAKISQEDTEYLAPISTVIAGVLVLLVSSMSGWLTLVVVMCFPLISGVCLSLAWRDVQQQVATAEYSGEAEQQGYTDTQLLAVSHPWHALKQMGRTGPGILVASLFVCLLGSFWQQESDDILLFQIVVIVSIIFTAIIALVSANGPQRISVSFLFRWMCPVLVLGFVAVIIWGDSWGVYAAFMISLAARFSFCLITQMFFAQYATRGLTTAAQAYGFGWIFVHLGDFLGVLTLVLLNPLFAYGVVDISEVAAVSVAVLTILTMFILNKRDSLALKTHADEKEQSSLTGLAAPEHALTDETGESRASKEAVGTGQLERSLRSLAKKYKLTPREVEVFELLARGRSVPFIRDSLVISRDTAATHVKHIYQKLGVHSRQELIDLVQN